MFGIGFAELIVIFIAAFVLLGPEKLYDVSLSAGRYIKAFKKLMKEASLDTDNITPAIKKHIKAISEDIEKTKKGVLK